LPLVFAANAGGKGGGWTEEIGGDGAVFGVTGEDAGHLLGFGGALFLVGVAEEVANESGKRGVAVGSAEVDLFGVERGVVVLRGRGDGVVGG
jgi:hypothetical protein